MTARAEIDTFWTIAEMGRNVALDINTKNGEIIARYTAKADSNDTNSAGLGTPPACYTDDWARIMCAKDGIISHGAER